MLYNSNFKVVEFDHFRKEAGLHTFTISAKEWIEKTDAIKNYIIPNSKYNDNLDWLVYADEADRIKRLDVNEKK